MFLKILNPNNLDLQDFCNWLIPKIKEYANNQSHWNQELVNEWIEYFNKYDFGWSRDVANQPIIPSFAFIVDSYFSNLATYTMNGAYFILANENLLLNYTNITIDSLASMINDGTVDKKGYPYFEDVFQYFADNLPKYFDSYMLESSQGD